MKRALSLLLALVMLAGMLPVFALAEDTDESGEPAAVETVEEAPAEEPAEEQTSCTHQYDDAVTAPTCTGQGYTTHICVLCGYSYADTYIEAAGHSPKDVPEIPATENTEGRTAGKVCSVCDTVLEGCEAIPAITSEELESDLDPSLAFLDNTVNILTADNFPDAKFLSYLQATYPYGLTASSAADVQYLDVSSKGISSLVGIEHFTALKRLICSGNSLTALDVSSNTALDTLFCGNNKLTALDVSNNRALADLNCANNFLTALNVSYNTALTRLYCGNNSLTALDVSKNTALEYLYCDHNSLTALNVSNNTALKILGCVYNSLTALDVSNNTALTLLYCPHNSLSTLNVSYNTALTNLNCGYNSLSALNVSSNTALTILSCENNSLTALDLSNITALESLDCGNNSLTSFSVSNNAALKHLRCAGIGLTSLNVSIYPALLTLDCGNNSLTALNVSNNTALTSLSCEYNSLTALNVSNNTALTRLYCYYNSLTALDVSNNTALEGLSCFNNNLSALNVSNNTALTDLECGRNYLSSLDLSNNTALEELSCYNNNLTSLDLSRNKALTYIYCSSNPITDIYFHGSQVQWNALNTFVPSGAVIHYNSSGPVDNLKVTVTVQGNGWAVGGGSYTPGDVVKMAAISGTGFVFVGWYSDTDALISDEVMYCFTITESCSLKAVFEPAPKLTLDKDYIVVAKNDYTRSVRVNLSSEFWRDYIVWSVENAGSSETQVLEVDSYGCIRPKSLGTAYVVATITAGGVEYTARCRVDVAVDDGRPLAPISMSLMDTKATVDLYSTNYTTVNVFLEREDLADLNASAAADAILDSGELPVMANNGAAITGAEFIDEATSDLFDIFVKDDRTLEIVPKYDALTNAGAVGSSYKSAITISVEGQEHDYETDVLTITVKKTLPKLKVTLPKFNTLIPGQSHSLTVTGGKVTDVEIDSTAAAKNPGKDASSWLKLDPDGSFKLEDGVTGSRSGTLYLLLTVEGWAAKQAVSVNVSAAETNPKIKFSPSSVKLTPKFGNTDTIDCASVAYTVTGEEFASRSLVISGIMEGKNSVENGKIILCQPQDGKVTVSVANAPADGKAHTYTVYTTLEGLAKPYSFKVTVQAAAANAKLTVKASGFIDTAIKDSPITFTCSFSNFNAGSGESYYVFVKRYNDKTRTYDIYDFSSLFTINQSGNIITLTEAEPGTNVFPGFPDTLEEGYSYIATVGVDITGDGIWDICRTQKLNIKRSNPGKVPVSVSVKASGTIDVIRPGTSVTVTPAVRNAYGYAFRKNNLEFYELVNKQYVKLEDAPFNVTVRDGKFIITANGEIHHTSKYYVLLRSEIYGTEYESSMTAIKVKMGSAKIAQNVKQIRLLKKDRFSRGEVKLDLADIALSSVSKVELDAASAQLFDLKDYGNGVYSIGYRDNRISVDKTKTVKLSVFLKGNTTDKANATVSVKVNLK